MSRRVKSSEDELAELFDAEMNPTTKGNERAFNEEYDNLREKFNKEYYINNNEKKARKIEDEYQDKIIQPMAGDLVKQKKDDERIYNSKFSRLKKILKGN